MLSLLAFALELTEDMGRRLETIVRIGGDL